MVETSSLALLQYASILVLVQSIPLVSLIPLLRAPFFFVVRDSRLQGDGWEIGAGSLVSGVRSVKAGEF